MLPQHLTLYNKIWTDIVASSNAKITPQDLEIEDITSIQAAWANYGETPNAHPVTYFERKTWREVRLFISSTFTDYFAEREMLVKQVIPQLRKWCQALRLTLVDIDLR
jgi:hypothetical protein